MIRFIFNEFKKNIKLFLLCFVVLLMLITSNINLLSIAFSVRTNIYDSLSFNVNSSIKNDGFEEFKECKIKPSSYSVSFSNINSLTRLSNKGSYPLINNQLLSYLYQVQVFNEVNEFIGVIDNIVGNDSLEKITDELKSKGTNYRISFDDIKSSLFFNEQIGFYKNAGITKNNNYDNILYMSSNMAEYYKIKNGEEVIVTAEYGSYKYIAQIDESDETYFYLSTDPISNINEYLEDGYITDVSLLDIHQYNNILSFVSSKFDIPIEDIKSQYVEDYITLSNVVIIVLFFIVAFILVLIGFILVKMIQHIIDSRQTMISTLSILGVDFKHIYLTYFILLSIFFIFTFLCSIGFNFVLNIFISKAFLLTFNIDYIYYHLTLCIILYFGIMLIYCFTSNFFVFNKLKKKNMYSLLREGKW